jgi:hypothetical protein
MGQLPLIKVYDDLFVPSLHCARDFISHVPAWRELGTLALVQLDDGV